MDVDKDVDTHGQIQITAHTHARLEAEARTERDAIGGGGGSNMGSLGEVVDAALKNKEIIRAFEQRERDMKLSSFAPGPGELDAHCLGRGRLLVHLSTTTLQSLHGLRIPHSGTAAS